MPSFHQVKILPYNTKELFYMVLDIKSYPKFLPWCLAARIITKNERHMIAELIVQLKGFSERYQSNIISKILDNETYLIEVEAISGPFKYLRTIWQFSKEDKNTKVEFFIDFKMKSVLFNKLISIFFARVTREIVTAFEIRAKSLIICTSSNIHSMI